ncbi:MAG: mannose-6-phosphate isomerase [Nanoarchaeota archaeon]|nr:mannose-6-phosphate isomerase [Nanoarchaeota archaeon]
MADIFHENRPWGKYKRFTLNEISTVKIIKVKPNSILSLQYHNKRREMWYFLTEGYVQIGNKKKKIKKEGIVEIPVKTLHRLYAKDKEVVVLEVSFGFFDENDIVRVEDVYGRK